MVSSHFTVGSNVRVYIGHRDCSWIPSHSFCSNYLFSNPLAVLNDCRPNSSNNAFLISCFQYLVHISAWFRTGRGFFHTDLWISDHGHHRWVLLFTTEGLFRQDSSKRAGIRLTLHSSLSAQEPFYRSSVPQWVARNLVSLSEACHLSKVIRLAVEFPIYWDFYYFSVPNPHKTGKSHVSVLCFSPIPAVHIPGNLSWSWKTRSFSLASF